MQLHYPSQPSSIPMHFMDPRQQFSFLQQQPSTSMHSMNSLQSASEPVHDIIIIKDKMEVEQEGEDR